MTLTTFAPPGDVAVTRARRPLSGLWSVASVRWAALALALFSGGLAAQLAGAPPPVWWTLYLACYAAGGWAPAWEGLQALRARNLDVDLLMVVAAIGAASIGQIFDGALLIIIFATSGALEDVATRRTQDSVNGLLDLAPERAVIVDTDGAERTVLARDVRAGDVVVVRPGERVSADGVVVGGASDVDQSSITGEPLPVAKNVDDEVFAGTLNGSGALRISVTRDASETVVARIVALVAEASATKAQTQLFIEKVEQRYSVVVVAATLALFAIPLLAGADLQSTLLRAMTFMIVASPCAVVLATMPPLLCAIANAGRHGVLVKSAVAMERLADTTTVALDKTGTLTTGSPQLTGIVALRPDRMGADAVLALAAGAETGSEHPLGRAVVAAARERGLTIGAAEDFHALPGRGVRARVGDRRVEVASPKGLSGQRIAAVTAAEARGGTAVLVVVDGEPAGVMELHDRTRPDAAAAVQAMAAMTNAGPVLLTGDNRAAATHLGGTVGIDDVRAELLPEDKVGAVAALQRDGQRVLVVGDGVNDAPAMAAADVAVAMGRSGADLTLDTADVVTVRDDLAAIPAVIALARRARRIVKANLVIAASAICVLVVWDLFGHLPLPLGVAGHEGSTILVALNGLRLLTNRAWRRAAMPQRPSGG
ncbi:heavy metal translocating P-type ATPase [Mycolicibacterium litorale]|uniref:Cobalt/nickel-exporting P-type ATPase n=1 Tax=Mycolicibacterium litorale TaxID=758802 RepID=A0AAD1IIV8_9MYCO|nr:heavy metal translocating P-type ATPase [Mycolicibacterium litorale]MCV7414550.1 cadmium-translocating P-type ATPase [Mycolicibacterium litorale]TDY03450.1 cation-transporting P-type ATPase D [Mycolicibacterium litorale]BBY15248.1 putative cobalt/nickel-exporting P-type ATPase [Mycolicibacterium litorale]